MRFKRLELIGQKFNRLTVIEYSHKDKRGNVCWLCKCDCGNEKILNSARLVRGKTKSCGCLKKENAKENVKKAWEKCRLPEGVAARNSVLLRHKKRAKRRNIEQALTDEQIIALHKENCYYCGASPSNICSISNLNGLYIYNGIDRIDNTKGYTMGNVASCCGYCNKAKGTKSVEDFMLWINNLVNYRNNI